MDNMTEEERLTTTVLQIISKEKKSNHRQEKVRAKDARKLHDYLVSVPLNAVQTGYRTAKELLDMMIVAEGIDHEVLMLERIRSGSGHQRVGQELSNRPGVLSSTVVTLRDFIEELRSEKLAAETGSRRGTSKDSADSNDEPARLLRAIRKQLVHD